MTIDTEYLGDVDPGEMSYVTQDLVSGETLNELPLRVSELPRNINGDADATFTLPLFDPAVRELQPRQSTEPGRTGLFALLNGQPIWGGIIWARQYSRASRVLTINASTVESYWRHRVFNQRMDITNRDQNEILYWLMTGIWPLAGFTNLIERKSHWALGPDYTTFTTLDPVDGMWIHDYDGKLITVADCIKNIDFNYTNDPDTHGFSTGVKMSGVVRDRSYAAGKNVYDAMVELSGVDRGAEWTLDPTVVDAGTPQARLGWAPRLGLPRLGRTADKTLFVWEASDLRQVDEESDAPGDNVRDYTYGEDARPSANHAVTTGSEVNGVVMVSDRGNLQGIRAGYPTLEKSTQYSDVIVQSTLDSHCLGDLQDGPIPLTVMTWDLDPNSEPMFGSYGLGDEAEFRASDDLYPRADDGTPGRISVERFVGWSYVPASDTQRAVVKAVTNPTTQPGAKLPPSRKKFYDDLERRARGLAVASRQLQSKVPVSMSNPINVLLPASGTAGTAGPETVIGSFFFSRQADYLHALIFIVTGTSAVDWYFYDTRDGSVLNNYTQTIYKGTANNNGAIYDIRLPLAGWEFGETVEVEFRGVATNGTTTRTLRTYAGYQGPS